MVLGALINHPEKLNRDTLYGLRTIVARFPYFQTARLLLLNNLYLLHDPDFGIELRRSVLYVADRRALCRLIEGGADCVPVDSADDIVADNPSVDRTLSLIDAFLATLPGEQEDSLLPAVDGVNDYVASFLVSDVPEVSGEECGLGVIDRFLEAEKTSDIISSDDVRPYGQMALEDGGAESSERSAPEQEFGEESLEESYFTETLARIYIKQHKYLRALEIIRSLYLKYPEKNVYFADQIRFLEKLIINNNSK